MGVFTRRTASHARRHRHVHGRWRHPGARRRQAGASGSYVWDLESQKIRHFRTPGQYNPWCLVFDKQGNGIVGDGTNANQHWANALSGGEVETRSSVDAIFDNEGVRPAAGNEILMTRQFPDEYHDQLIYACVINMHGMPAFELKDDPDSAGMLGESRGRSTDVHRHVFFGRLIPRLVPTERFGLETGANALIGHMQYSQRDPNRDHEHGRVYRLVHTKNPLLTPLTQSDKSVEALLEQLTAFETRTRYRVRRELRGRKRDEVLAAVSAWAAQSDDPGVWREALWVQESFHAVDRDLVARVMKTDDFTARAAAIHVVGNQWQFMDNPNEFLRMGAKDEHARVRMETVRAASLQPTVEAVQIAASVTDMPMDKWIDYVLAHALQTLEPLWEKRRKRNLDGVTLTRCEKAFEGIQNCSWPWSRRSSASQDDGQRGREIGRSRISFDESGGSKEGRLQTRKSRVHAGLCRLPTNTVESEKNSVLNSLA